MTPRTWSSIRLAGCYILVGATCVLQVDAAPRLSSLAVLSASSGLFIDCNSKTIDSTLICVPDGFCELPWAGAFDLSEDAFSTAYSRGYTESETAVVFNEWAGLNTGSCDGDGGYGSPKIPFNVPESDRPLSPPDRPEPICTGPCNMDPPLGPKPKDEPKAPLCMDVLGCGDFPKPAPDSGGSPNPQEICSGMSCAWPDSAPDHSPGPDPKDYCMGLSCDSPGIGNPTLPGPASNDASNIPCMGLECPGMPMPVASCDSPRPDPRTICDCPDWPSVTPNPVDVRYGFKVESDADLVVPVTGRDFILARSYSSKPDLAGPALVGANWTLNVFMFMEKLDTGETAPLRVSTPTSGARRFNYQATPDRWEPTGPSSQYIIKTSLTIGSDVYPIYRLVEPGSYELDFYRANGTSETGGSWMDIEDREVGLIMRHRDLYGNYRHYEYVDANPGAPESLLAKRLSKIELYDNTDSLEASVHFTWRHTPISDTSLGMVQKVEVKRYPGSAQVVQRVEYFYNNSSYSDDLGTERDLVQVVKWSKVDRAPSGAPSDDTNDDEYGWYLRVTQYRYHLAWANRETDDGDGDGFIQQGNKHQLKAVILPQQIEYAAQKANASSSNLHSVKTFANSLLTKDDHAVAYTGGEKVIQLAGKVVEKYGEYSATDSSKDGRVLTQFLQTSCGCGGSSAQGLRLVYDYMKYTPSVAGDYKLTTKVTENYFDGSSWQSHLTRYYDVVEYPVSQGGATENYLLLKTQVTSDGTNEWVSDVVYDGSTRAISKWRPPAAFVTSTAYDLGTPTTKPSIGTLDNGTKQYEYTYVQSGQRLESVSVRETGGSLHLLKKVTYDSTRPWLVTKIEYPRDYGVLTTTLGSEAADDVQTVEFLYDFHSGDKIKWIEAKFEAETAAENGPGGSYYSHNFYDSEGRNHWTRMPDGTLVKRSFDDDTGAITQVVSNSSSTGLPSHDGTATGLVWGRDSNGGTLTHSYTYDLLGRVTSVTYPTGVATRFVREMREQEDANSQTADDQPGIMYYTVVGLPWVVSTSPSLEFMGAAGVTWFDAAGQAIASAEHKMVSDQSTGYGSIFSGYDYNLDVTSTGQTARYSVERNLAGQNTTFRQWHSLAGEGDSGGSYETTFVYDDLGRLEDVTGPNGSMTRNVYDALGRVIEVKVGTNASNLSTVAQYFYDHTMSGSDPVQGLGNGNLTWVREYTGETSGTTVRNTKYTYDYRDRLVVVENPAAPHSGYRYDNLDRPTEVAVFSSAPSASWSAGSSDSTRGMYAKTSYSQRGRVYRQQVAKDSTLASGSMTFLESHAWFDPVGRTVASWGPNGPATKVTYDGLGRAIHVYVTDRGGDGAPGSGSYAHVYDDSTAAAPVAKLTDDVVFEKASYTYRASKGMLDLVTTAVRTHIAPDTATGDLSGLSGTYSVISYVAKEYDTAARLIRVKDFGTNNSSGFVTSGASAPTSSGDPLIWNGIGDEITVLLTYNALGQVEKVTDPLGKETKIFYDDMSRRIAVAENYVDATVTWNGTSGRWVAGGLSSSNPDVDRVTSFVYNLSSQYVEQNAHLDNGSGETVQTTRYVYGVAAGSGSADSRITSNDLLKEVRYPDETTGAPGTGTDYTVSFAYNRLGEPRFTRDQNLVVHTYTRDALGRVTEDLAALDTGGNSNIDFAIDRIAATYDAFGRPATIKSLNSSTVKNAVRFDYTGLWQLARFYQDPDGDITVDGSDDPTGNTKRMTYTYDTVAMSGWTSTAGGNYSRPTAVEYPSGHDLELGYELGWTSGTHKPDYFISRVREIKFDGVSEVEYQSIGLFGTAVVEYVQPYVILDWSLAHDGSRTDGEYPGIDRFGRVVRQVWADGNIAAGTGGGAGFPTIPPIVELAYSFNKVSNITEKWDQRPGSYWNRDQKYGYDELHRLVSAQRGKRGTGGSFTDYAGGQQWTLDFLGNFKEFDTDLVSTFASYTTDDRLFDGSFNMVNEITQLTKTESGGSPVNLPFTYDKAGQIEEKATASGMGYIYRHDAWGRLVKVQFDAGNSTYDRGVYQYNGLHMRVIKQADSDVFDNTNDLDEQRLMYYSPGWQLLEEHVYEGWSSGSPGAVDRLTQTVWGGRYIDDVVMRRQNNNYNDGADTDFIDAGDRAGDYYLTDHQFSVIALIDVGGNLVERVSYDSYGEARHHWMADVDGDGDVDATDDSTLRTADNKFIYDTGYDVSADIDRSGKVDSTDGGNTSSGNWVAALPAGVISASAVDNIYGYCGYIFNHESFIYTVRFRHYDPATGVGRWLERDPAGYVDSANLYSYVLAIPTNASDPLGLIYSTAGHPNSVPAELAAHTALMPINRAIEFLLAAGIPPRLIAQTLGVSVGLVMTYVLMEESGSLDAAADAAEDVAETAAEVLDDVLQELLDLFGGADSLHAEPATGRRSKGGVSIQIITVGGWIIHDLIDKAGKRIKGHPHRRKPGQYKEGDCD